MAKLTCSSASLQRSVGICNSARTTCWHPCMSPGVPLPASGDCMSVGPKTRARFDSVIFVVAAALASFRR